MKVTSKQLLDLFGLKVGDSIEVNFLIEEFVPKLEKINFKVKKDLMLEGKSKIRSYLVEKHLIVLLDKDYEIIKPTPKLSDDEKVILRNLPIEYKGYLARYETQCDGFSILIACKSKPIKDNDLGVWSSNDDFTILPYDHLFQFITWEDEEPYNIEELLKGDE